MIETQMGLLNEIISNMAKKFEEEKKELENACAGKDAEIGRLRQEIEARDRARDEDQTKEKEQIESTIRRMDQMMMDERAKWREALRSN